jgi:hypothetical protein
VDSDRRGANLVAGELIVRSLAVYIDDLQNIRQLGLNLHMPFQSRRDIYVLYARLIHRTQAGYLDPARQRRRSGDYLV